MHSSKKGRMGDWQVGEGQEKIILCLIKVWVGLRESKPGMIWIVVGPHVRTSGINDSNGEC